MIRASLALVFAFVIVVPSRAQTPDTSSEGPLQNDDRLESVAPANQAFANGDLGLAKLRAQKSISKDDLERARNAVFESWHSARNWTQNGERVDAAPTLGNSPSASPFPDFDATAKRRTEGAEEALVRRIAALDPDERAAWRARFEPLSIQRLAAAGGNLAALAVLESELPATSGAARAALLEFDASFEEGRATAAAMWLARAARQRALIDRDDADFDAALARRRQALDSLRNKPRDTTDEAWRTARKLEVTNDVPVIGADPGAGALTRVERSFEDTRPGIAILRSKLAAIQWDHTVEVFDPKNPRVPRPFDPELFLRSTCSIDVEMFPAVRRLPAWRHTPLAVEDDLVLLVGFGPTEKNVVVRLTPPSNRSSAELAPRLVWALTNSDLYGADGHSKALPDSLRSPESEFQPGAVLVGDLLLVLAVEHGSNDLRGANIPAAEALTSLWALDAATGRPLWRRALDKRAPGPRPANSRLNRFALGGATWPPLPIAVVDRFAFVGSNAGFGALVECGDGRTVWMLANRRRDENAHGPTLGGALVDRKENSILWLPADSDRIYALRAAPTDGAHGVFARPPRELGSLDDALDFDGRRALFTSGSKLVEVDLESGARVESFELGPLADFRGAALVSPTRALVANERGVALFDRERELYLLSSLDLGERCFALAAVDGSVIAVGDFAVHVLAAH